jgi:hypothetical protein
VGNTLIKNTAGLGGGIACIGNKPGLSQNGSPDPAIHNNFIVKNQGSGIYCFYGRPFITNTTFYGNAGDAIYCDLESNAEVHDSILWGKTIRLQNASYFTISYSDSEGGQAPVQKDPQSILNWGPGMIDADPLFVDPANGDFHLTFTSPCKDTGDNYTVTERTDFEGDPRIVYGTVDMGADEFYTHLYWTGDATPGGDVEVKFVGLPGTAPVGLCIGSGILDPPIPSMWGDWYLMFPIIGPVDLGSITSPEGVLVVPGTIPGTSPAPYSLPMQALIGAELSNLCVLEVK